MSKAHIRHLPVVEEGHLLGIISIGDVVRAVINGQQSTITSLENYILRHFISAGLAWGLMWERLG